MNNISIIIPVRNRFQGLCKCLDSITLQECNMEFEVIVVDDGSNEEIPDISKGYEFKLRIIRQVPLGIASARNRGIQESKGYLLLFVDSDCTLEMNCLFNLFQATIGNPNSVAFQLKLVGKPNNIVGAMEHLRLTAVQDVKAKGEHIEYINTSGFALKRSFVTEIDFFPLNVIRGEDTCILAKLMSKGIKPYFITDAVVEHSPRYALPKYIAKHFLIGYQAYASHVILKENGDVTMAFHDKALMVKKFHEIASKEKISKISIYFILLAYAFECCGRKTFCLFGMKSQRLKVFSTDLDPVRGNELVSKVLTEVERKNGAVITYLTAWSLVQSKRDSEFKMLLSKFDIVYADGMGVVLTLFLTTLLRIKKVTMNDLYESVIEECSNRKYRVAFVGGKQGVALKVANFFNDKYPLLKTVLYGSGYLNKENESLLISKLSQSKPDIVLVGMGQPRQEKFVCSIKQQMPHTVFWCVGGLFDYIVGINPTPPIFIRRIGMEWLYKFVNNPTMFYKRYLFGLPLLAFYIVKEIVKNNLRFLKVIS